MRAFQTIRRCGMAAAMTAALVAGITTADAGAPKLEFLGQATFPTGYIFDGTQVGGLSGIDYDRATDTYYAISDDRSQNNPARFYTLAIDLSDGSLDDGDVTFESVVTMLDTNGQPFPVLGVDPESIRFDRKRNSLFWTSEGDANALVRPFVREMALDGSFVRALTIPVKYTPASDKSSGIRNNLAFESLTLTPSGSRIWTATENALVQDGPASSVTDATPCRFLQLDVESGEPTREYVYVAELVADVPVPPTQFATNGLVEIIYIGNETFLTMERSFSTGVGNVIKLYLADASRATNVKRFDSLVGKSYRPVTKTLLANLADFGIIPDNVEGITVGPKLADGRQTLILVADNNFSTTQVTQFIAFAVK